MWALLAAPLHRILDSEKTTTRNSVDLKVTTTGFVRATVVNNSNNNLTSLSQHPVAILSLGSSNYN